MATDLERAAELGAQKAIERMMLILGVDVHSSTDLNALRADLYHARKIRTTSEKIGWVAVAVIVTSLVGGAVAFVVAGFKAAMGVH